MELETFVFFQPFEDFFAFVGVHIISGQCEHLTPKGFDCR